MKQLFTVIACSLVIASTVSAVSVKNTKLYQKMVRAQHVPSIKDFAQSKLFTAVKQAQESIFVEIEEAYHLSEEEKAEYQEIFNYIDSKGDGERQGDGIIDAEELKRALNEIGAEYGYVFTIEETSAMVKVADQDRSGGLDQDEFFHFVEFMQSDFEDQLRQVFHIVDQNGDGLIDRSEFGYILSIFGIDENQENADFYYALFEQTQGQDGQVGISEKNFLDLFLGAQDNQGQEPQQE